MLRSDVGVLGVGDRGEESVSVLNSKVIDLIQSVKTLAVDDQQVAMQGLVVKTKTKVTKSVSKI